MNTDTDIIALQDSHAEAGAIVWWSLSGDTDILDMEDALEGQDFDASWKPNAPRIETIVKRAAMSMATGKRQLVRPLKTRGSQEFVTESVEVDSAGKEHLVYTPNVRVLVDRSDSTTAPAISVQPATDADQYLAEEIQGRFRYYSGVMSTVDMSNWLLQTVDRVSAVSLRDRGGFYFVPKGPDLDTWRRAVAVVNGIGDHKVCSMPAMKSEDAVEAILHAVRREADSKMTELEEYLAGDVSTRGLNSWMRTMEALQAKTNQYAELLGVELPELTERAETCLGGLGAARMMKGAPAAPTVEVAAE